MESSMGGLTKLGSGDIGKDPFKQRGGTFGLLILAVAALAVVLNISALYSFAQSLLGLVVCGVATAGILYVAFDKRFRLMVSTLYMMGIRKMMGLVVKMDPISILKDGIRKMYLKIANMEANMGKLNGVRIASKRKVKEKKEQFEQCLVRQKAAENLQKQDVAIVEKRQAARLYEMVKQYQEMADSADKWYNAMDKVAAMAKLYAQDAENEVEAQEERYTMIKLSHSAFKSAMSVIKGDPDDLALYNQAFQFVNDDIMNRIGEMDRVVNTAGGLLDKIDVEKEMFGIKGDDLMRKYNEIGLEGMFSNMSETPITLSSLMEGKREVNTFTTSQNIIKITPNQSQGNTNSKSKYL